MEQRLCLICAEEFDRDHLRCVVSCGHDEVCGICFLRLRALQRNFSCPSCKAALEAVICVDKDDAKFSDFTIWGDSIGPDHMYDERSQVYFPKPFFKAKVESLFACACRVPTCRQTRRDMKNLKLHMQNEHKLNFCQLCIDHKQAFPAEQKVYTQAQYETHLRCGDGDGGDGHPLCQFCRKRYYDKVLPPSPSSHPRIPPSSGASLTAAAPCTQADLFVHLSRDHFSCFLCEREGIQVRLVFTATNYLPRSPLTPLPRPSLPPLSLASVPLLRRLPQPGGALPQRALHLRGPDVPHEALHRLLQQVRVRVL
jgi:hypothetical protein